MWTPADPDEPLSEPYRLMPPRQRSELREALDAAAVTGSGRDPVSRADDGDGEPGVSAAPAAAPRDARRPAAAFLGSVTANALGTILATGFVALIVYLWAHFH